MNNVLYIFIDESGNFDFSPNGSKYFVLTAVSTMNPLHKRVKFSELRYDLLTQSVDQEFFHATEDVQTTRDKVFGLIQNQVDDVTVDSVIAQKNKAHFSLYSQQYVKVDRTIGFTKQENEFYRIIGQTLLRYILTRHKQTTLSQVVIVLSSIFTKNKMRIVTKALKTYLKQYAKYPFHIYFHCSQADINSQIADYCGWAIYVKYERGEVRPYNQIKAKIKSEFDIFHRGTTEWYSYRQRPPQLSFEEPEGSYH